MTSAVGPSARTLVLVTAASLVSTVAFFVAFGLVAPLDWWWTLPVAGVGLVVVVILGLLLRRFDGRHLVVRSTATAAEGLGLLPIACALATAVAVAVALLTD
ncbi:hypothetical protein ITJ60_09015 [Curtobacterium sp. VKM Ac-2884]|nr:hypothetical protein [Curtobacterium sp. VKM Ac-2884]